MNPWLEIPLEEYEAHMQMDSVRQGELISGVLVEAMEAYKPKSLCYVGCAGGFGLDEVDSKVEVAGMDINPLYIEEAIGRYGSKFEKSEFIVHDINRKNPFLGKYELVYVALVLEYVDNEALTNISDLVTDEGVIVFLLQKESKHVSKISSTPYKVLNKLESIFCYINQGELHANMNLLGYGETFKEEVVLRSNKGFSVVHYQKRNAITSL